MSATATETAIPREIEESTGVAYQLATERAIKTPHAWQTQLFQPLVEPACDAGYLILTPTGSGKTEAVIIPSVGIQHGGAPRRMFVISADGSSLDDPVLRIGRYLKAWAIADGSPRTLYIDADDEGTDGKAIRFSNDGTEESDISVSPLEADVDVVLTTIKRFQDLFFGSGGVHGLPSALAVDDGQQFRRDLFFFDEAQSYSTDRFSLFLRLVEFLFAEDNDVIVGSSTMPPSFEEELSFLEKVVVPAAELPVQISYLPADDALTAIAREAKARYSGTERVVLVVENASDADALADRLESSIATVAYRYLPYASHADRRRLYSSLLDHERVGQPHLVITTGQYLASSNLDFDSVITSVCLPEDLILRAGRCNRRGKLAEGQLVVVGSTLEKTPRSMNVAQRTAYLEALEKSNDTRFDPNMWKPFI